MLFLVLVVAAVLRVRVGRLKDGMAFNLSVGLQGVPISEAERKGSGAEGMQTFAMVIAGVVCVARSSPLFLIFTLSPFFPSSSSFFSPPPYI